MRQVRALMRLSELRLQSAERHLGAMRLALQQAEAHLQNMREEAAALTRKINAQRNAAREAFVGAYHARAAVELMMSEMAGLDTAVEDAKARVVTAGEAVEAARPPVAEAQKAVLAARNKLRKREELARQMRRTAEHAKELARDMDAEEQWVGQQGYGGLA